MAIHKLLHGRIYPMFETMANTLHEDRPSLAPQDHAPHNMAIILFRACVVEGVLEEQAYRVIAFFRAKFRLVEIPEFSTRKPVNVFVNRMVEDLEFRVGRTTGIDNFSALLNSILGASPLASPAVAPYAEGIRALFQLRNVIAHGRAVRASIQLRGASLDSGDENFAGGYSLAEKYLLKVGVITKKFTSEEKGEWIFSDDVADHFSMVSSQFMKGLTAYIDSNLDGLERSTIAPIRRE